MSGVVVGGFRLPGIDGKSHPTNVKSDAVNHAICRDRVVISKDMPQKHPGVRASTSKNDASSNEKEVASMTPPLESVPHMHSGSKFMEPNIARACMNLS
jgi:hypothetical protein